MGNKSSPMPRMPPPGNDPPDLRYDTHDIVDTPIQNNRSIAPSFMPSWLTDAPLHDYRSSFNSFTGSIPSYKPMMTDIPMPPGFQSPNNYSFLHSGTSQARTSNLLNNYNFSKSDTNLMSQGYQKAQNDAGWTMRNDGSFWSKDQSGNWNQGNKDNWTKRDDGSVWNKQTDGNWKNMGTQRDDGTLWNKGSDGNYTQIAGANKPQRQSKIQQAKTIKPRK